MPERSLRDAPRAAAFALCAATALGSVAPGAVAQSVAPLVEVIDASESDRSVNVLVQFRCTVRYLAHDPPESGTTVTARLRLGPDCGVPPGATAQPERPVLTGNSNLVRAARLEGTFPGEVAVTLDWRQQVNFVLVPTTSGRGLRLRLLDVLPGRRGSVTVQEPGDPLSGYAINLASSTAAFAPEALEEASRVMHLPSYVSTIELEGSTWYRLRVGPIVRRRDADRVLLLAQQRYPRAWLGINDEPSGATTEVVDVGPEVAPTLPVDPALPDEERRALLEAARKAMARREYARAIEILTKLTRQPEYPDRARAQEMLGLARERAGQLAHAKAEYTEYLRRYPDGEAAPRLRTRLRMLSSAARRGRGGTLGGGGDEFGWKLSGGASQMYRWERAELDAPEANISRDTQNAVYTDGDLVARRRGARFDFTGRVSAGFAKDLLQDGPGDQTRVSSAFVELNDREFGLAGRLGRQSRNAGGLLGTFDGLHASWQARPKVALSAAAGFPVESTRDAANTDRRFLGLAADFGPFHERWDVGAFAVAQQYSGETDRRAIGVETRYFVPGRTILGLVDYDLYYGGVNTLVLMGNLQLPARWSASFNLDHRRSPVLTTRNALIGQPAETLDELLGIFTSEEVRELAEDRTPLSDIITLSLSRVLGERYSLTLDAFAARVGATPASGGIPATPATPFEETVQLQLVGSSLLRASDLFVISARYQNGAAQRTGSVGLWSRLPLGAAWRFGPRIRVDRRESTVDASTETLVVPSLRVDYQKGSSWLEFEGSTELGRRTIPAESERSRRYYVSIGYRIGF